MKAQAIPVAIMSGIIIYAGIYHVLVYLRRRQERVNLYFSLLCFAVGLYAFFAAGLYNVSSVAEGIPWLRAQGITPSLIVMGLLWFVDAYTGQMSKKVRNILSVYLVLATLFAMIDRSDLTLQISAPSIKEIALPFGVQVTYYEVSIGPFTNFNYIASILIFAYVLGVGVQFYRRGHRQEATPLLIALGLFFLSAFNDVAVSSRVYPFIYTIEYSYSAVVLMMAYSLSGTLTNALTTIEQRGQALSETSRQAERAAQAEREARERETSSATHLRETVRSYTRYLERVAVGDYAARLDVGELYPEIEGDTDLHAMGEYLNSTVDTLVAAVGQMQEVQRRYTAGAWQQVVDSGAVERGVRYDGQALEPAADAWLPQMAEAIANGNTVVGQDGLAVPIVVNRQVIGAIGGRRPDGRPWSQEDLDLISDATGQLAQTIESLRLLDETQRNAARERTVGEITGRMRESLDVDTVLQTAAREIEQSLGLYDVTIRLSPSPEDATG
ncbi:MAG: GAF domain-containing protein [Anaerolineae bacterium]|nr:GAF domain-containing protein [Anaerolineae bacterium]